MLRTAQLKCRRDRRASTANDCNLDWLALRQLLIPSLLLPARMKHPIPPISGQVPRTRRLTTYSIVLRYWTVVADGAILC
jgi:hypothetical protein